MKSKKITKKKKIIKKQIVKKKSVKKTVKKKLVKKITKKEKKQKIVERLMKKGFVRGFITYGEILKEFPDIETDILFLDDLYQQFQDNNIDVLEGRELLEIGGSAKKKIPSFFNRGRGNLPKQGLDPIQMYLKEIGKMPL